MGDYRETKTVKIIFDTNVPRGLYTKVIKEIDFYFSWKQLVLYLLADAIAMTTAFYSLLIYGGFQVPW